jgi:hypothetical protein
LDNDNRGDVSYFISSLLYCHSCRFEKECQDTKEFFDVEYRFIHSSCSHKLFYFPGECDAHWQLNGASHLPLIFDIFSLFVCPHIEFHKKVIPLPKILKRYSI